MSSQSVEAEIRELEAVRRASTLWRWGTLAATLVLTVGGVALMNNAVQGLIRPGPTQDRFVGAVSTNLQTNVVPGLQTLATRTITEAQPIVQEELGKLNARMPEVAGGAMKEFNLLQTELPERSATALNATFGKVLAERKTKLKTMFPDATDEQIDAFIANMTEQGQKSMTNVSVNLFSPHIEEISAVSDNIERIQKADAGRIKGDVPTWEMGILLFDIARADMGDLQLTSTGSKTARAGSQSIDQENKGITGTGIEKTSLKLPAVNAGVDAAVDAGAPKKEAGN